MFETLTTQGDSPILSNRQLDRFLAIHAGILALVSCLVVLMILHGPGVQRVYFEVVCSAQAGGEVREHSPDKVSDIPYIGCWKPTENEQDDLLMLYVPSKGEIIDQRG